MWQAGPIGSPRYTRESRSQSTCTAATAMKCPDVSPLHHRPFRDRLQNVASPVCNRLPDPLCMSRRLVRGLPGLSSVLLHSWCRHSLSVLTHHLHIYLSFFDRMQSSIVPVGFVGAPSSDDEWLRTQPVKQQLSARAP